MKKRFMLFIIMILTIIIIPSVNADGLMCYYEYYSPTYGYSVAQVNIQGDNNNNLIDSTSIVNEGVISVMNSEEQKATDGIVTEKWNGKHALVVNEFFSFKKHNYVCPYYCLMDTSGVTTLTLSYDKSVLESISKTKLDQGEAHVAISTSVKDDKAKNNDTYDTDKDNPVQSDLDTRMNIPSKAQTITRTCTYVANSSDREKYGYSSIDLVIYKDKNGVDGYESEVKMLDGHTVSVNRSSDSILKAKWDGNTYTNATTNAKCPAYATYTGTKDGVIGSLVYSDQKRSVPENNSEYPQRQMVSTTIRSDKADYDPNKDDLPTTLENERQYASSIIDIYGYGDGTNSILNSDAHVGDNYCEQPEVIKASRVLGIFVFVSRMAIPLMIIIWATFDLIKTINSGKIEDLKKEAIKLGIRILLGIFVFLFPAIVKLAFNSMVSFKVVSSEYEKCEKCIFDPFNKQSCQTQSGNALHQNTGTSSIKDAFKTTTTTRANVELIHDPETTKSVY